MNALLLVNNICLNQDVTGLKRAAYAAQATGVKSQKKVYIYVEVGIWTY